MSIGESASTSSNNRASAGTANWFDEAHLDVHGIDAGAGHLLLDERADAVAAISEFLDLDRT